jgi:hypothetical protein
MRPTILRTALAVASVAGGLAFVTPAHAEVVDVNVIVSDDFGATAYAFSDKPGETFDPVSVTRYAVTVAGGVTTASGSPTVAGIPGAETGAATYVISAHPAGSTNETFNFVAVVECVKAAVTGMVCTPSVGLHTVITVVTGPLD